MNFEYVDMNNRNSLIDLEKFYSNIYVKCFNDANEIESLDNLHYYLSQCEDNCKYFICIMKDDCNKILGGAIYDYFVDAHALIIEFIAIDPDLQSRGLGDTLYRNIVSNLNFWCEYIFIEIDNPELSNSANYNYLHFWSKHHFKRVNFNYIQPALDASKSAVTNLWLAVQSEVDCIPSHVVKTVIYDYMKYCFQISNPSDNIFFNKMDAELRQNDNMSLYYILIQIQVRIL